MANWSNEPQPFGQNRVPALSALASDGSGVVPLAADKTTGRLLVNATGSSGGTSSTFGTTFPTTGTAVGVSDGTNMQPLLVDGSGYLEVNVKTGGGGGTQYQELATTTPATGTLALGRYLASLPTLTTGEMNEPMLDSSSRLLTSTNLTQINGSAISNSNPMPQTLTDTVNTANVVAGDSGFNGVATASATKTYTFTTSASGAQTLLANTYVAGYSTITVNLTAVGSGLAWTGQFAPNTGGTYNAASTFQSSNTNGSPGALGTTVNVSYTSAVKNNYFQLAISALASGTVSGYVTLSNGPMPYGSLGAAQIGTWSVGSNSATGSAVPANAFYVGIKGGSGDLDGWVEISQLGDGSGAAGVGAIGSMLYNGTSWDRVRSTAASNNTAGTGLLGTGPLAMSATALPTAVTTPGTDYVQNMADKFGRQVVLPQAPRDLVGFQTTTFTASTSSSTVLTGASSIFSDITSIVLANSGASATLFTLSDGTNSYEYYVPAGDMRGATYQVPLAATTVDTNWTGQCGTSTSSLYCTITYIKNR